MSITKNSPKGGPSCPIPGAGEGPALGIAEPVMEGCVKLTTNAKEWKSFSVVEC